MAVHTGIIPARAGFTHPASPTSLLTWDHPRSRGVYAPPARSRRLRGGSSPLARGLRCNCLGVGVSAGIIPARAGFTPRRGFTDRGLPDHPRSRGVYRTEIICRWTTLGSSPLARGLRHMTLDGVMLGGIIPARAGFTLTIRASRASTPDHPRSRGVYISSLRAFSDPIGSSPLARGLREDRVIWR